MKIISNILPIIILLVGGTSLACDCDITDPFLTKGISSDVIIRGRITAHIAKDDRPCAMKVSVLETLKGNVSGTEIVIWGDNGWQCRPPVTQFPTNTEWILGITTNGWRNESGYFISVCGAYWLKCEDGVISGRIDSDTESSLSLPDFKKQLKQ